VTKKTAAGPAAGAGSRRAGIYWRRLRRQPVALAGTVIFALFLLVAIFGPLAAPYDYTAQNAAIRLQSPSLTHLMGTDNYGRDVLSRVLVGAREVFFLGGVGTVFAAIIGTSLGLLAGYVGRLWDEAIMRVLDVLLAFPALLLAMVLLATLGPSNLNLILVIAVLYIPMFARIARSMVLDLRTREFVEAARLRGETRRYILLREVLPNSLPPLLVEASIRFAYSIFLVASLGFLGLGVQPPSPDWGRQVNEARTFFDLAPWMLLFPTAAISLLVIGTSLMADGLRQVFGPPGADEGRRS
jgi:peptide/nickel transport system permease protein